VEGINARYAPSMAMTACLPNTTLVRQMSKLLTMLPFSWEWLDFFSVHSEFIGNSSLGASMKYM
jgi:hypothetical protein